MRKIAFVLSFVLPLCTGCLLTGDRAHTGWSIHIDHPSSVDTNMPVLVQSGQTQTQAHPLGTVAGPVTSGDFSHGVMQPTPAAPLPRAGAQIGVCDPVPPQCGPPRLTVQEFKEAASAINSRTLPPPSIKDAQ